MPTNLLHTPKKLFVVVALGLALSSCGSNSPAHFCAVPASSGPTCICPGTGSCPIMLNQYLYTSGDSGQILTFNIDSTTGALTGPFGSATGPASMGMAVVDNQFLFVSDPLHAQLDGFSINQNGTLGADAGSPFAIGHPSIPTGLVSPSGSNLLYVAEDGEVDAFNIGANGTPTAVTGSPFPSGTNLFLTTDPYGKFLYTSIDDPPGGIFGFTIGATGALTEIAGSPFTIPGQTVANSQPSGIVDNATYVYVALSGSNQIAGFSVASDTGALTPVPNSPFAAGTEPMALVLTNSFLYAINAVDFTVSGYSVNSSTGELTPLANSPFAIAGTAIAADFTGQYLYVPAGPGIQAFNIDSTTGNLSPISGSPFTASGVVSLTVVPE